MDLAVGDIFIDPHLSVAHSEEFRIVGVVDLVLDHQVQFLVYGMSILDLMNHLCAGKVVLGLGPLFEQGAVVQGISGIVACPDSYSHGGIHHGHIFLELDAVLIVVEVVRVYIMSLLYHMLPGKGSLAIQGSGAVSVVLHSRSPGLGIDIAHMIAVTLYALLKIKCGIGYGVAIRIFGCRRPIYIWPSH